ncbi:uncharacterized protein [Clytia hemisphaerica]|uniref:uncharacterized protein n=1 Tax=Clytia hemisphaerica TaxID=252671 RepID=UPI0034D5B81A
MADEKQEDGKQPIDPVDLFVEVEVLKDDIGDFVDEMSFDVTPAREIIATLKELRSEFRTKHTKIKLLIGTPRYNTDYKREFDDVIQKIKTGIEMSKEAQSKEAATQKTILNHQEKSKLFQVNTTLRIATELESEWCESTIPQLTDDQLLKLQDNQKVSAKKLETVTQNYQEILKYPAASGAMKKAVEELGKKYDFIISKKTDFLKDLEKEVDQRELNKRDLIKEGKLNINLAKFSGYDSPLDIYTFQTEFEKLYVRTTTKRMLPDLLINNHLSEPALSLVKHVDKISEIWERLKATYGDTRFLLARKVAKLDNISQLGKTKDPEKLIAGISQIISLMRDLLNLASKHNIEKNLFYGEGLEKIYRLMGNARMTQWLKESCELEANEKVLWNQLLLFLEKELKVEQQRLRFCGNNEKSPPGPKGGKGSCAFFGEKQECKKCLLCGAKDGEHDHVSTGSIGSKVIQYFSCRAFAEKTPSQRFSMLRRKGFCFQCLYPGADWNKGKHAKGECQAEFICPHPSHNSYPKKKHVLLCDEHKNSKDNEELLERYKAKCMRNPSLPSFSREIKLSFHASSAILTSEIHQPVAEKNVLQPNVPVQNFVESNVADSEEDIKDRGIYMLQQIKLHSELFNIFFDSGCSDFLITEDAVNRLGSSATMLSKVPVSVGGIAGSKTISDHGLYRIKLPLSTGKHAQLSGLCLPKLTDEFPRYSLCDAEKSLFDAAGAIAKIFPKLPKSAGGKVDMMIGISYFRYFPKLIFQSPTGLSIFKSVFRSSDGTTGVLGGPHESFSRTFDAHLSATFYTELARIRELSIVESPTIQNSTPLIDHTAYRSNILKSFESAENAGSQITYRCTTCRNCKDCKSHESIEAISIKEEAEQAIINSSVSIDTNTCTTTARLPLMFDPVKRLAPNKSVALKVYSQQIKKLNNPTNAQDKSDVLESEAKLQKLGFVDYVKNLPADVQVDLRNNPVQNFIPWRAVWKPTSISTPCRIVFDASMVTSSGYSLNDILAKGKNGLNKLQEIAIRWSTHQVGIHSDISKMYNTIRLDQRDWCLQRYIWHENLDPTKIPDEKVIKTLIYGVKPSGNQAEYGLRKIADMSKNEFPETSRIIKKDIYVDDCISGAASLEMASQRADEMELIVNRGGYKLKGITLSGENPNENLSDDGKSLVVAGLKWFPKDDVILLNIGELNFAKRKRGRKPPVSDNSIPERLTKRHCASKVGEIYDLLGKMTPISAGFKLDLHDLVIHKLDWDDAIPKELRPTWINNFQMMQEMKTVYFKRCVVPEDAESLSIETIDTGDASSSIACSAIYSRIKRRSGDYCCQLLFARSKILPDHTSQPRAEMIAALLNIHTSEVVKRSLGDLHKSSMKLCDSQVVLHWIGNDKKPLKQWVRDRVIEIRRFSQPSDWYYVSSKNMIADLGTRRGCSIEDISMDSDWINGYEWMSKDQSEFPVTPINSLKLDASQITEANKETYPQESTFLSNQSVPSEVKKHFDFLQYIIDPNKHSYSKVIRLMTMVMKFIRKILSRKVNPSKLKSHPWCKVVSTSDTDKAKSYYFKKCTAEIQHFLPKKKYEKISRMKDGVLIYTGRVLTCDDITVTGRFTKAMKDLSSTSFCVPLVDKHSPVAYAIVNDVHWNDQNASHRGIETTLRAVLRHAYILEVRSIIKAIKRSCPRCRYLEKKTIEVAMGPIPSSRLTVAPAFYMCQVDLSGPYKAFSPHNKRATIKIWLVVFCCSTTSSTSIKVMDDYSTPAFLQAFIRFASDAGFPKTLYCDEGSQLLKGCKDMRLKFKDTVNQLHQDVEVEFNSCPVGGHNFHGKVERRIQEINKSLERSISNERLSLLQWETLSSQIANCINNQPIGIRNEVSDFESMDLLTPNRLRLGRNNERSPEGEMLTTIHPNKILDANQQCFDAWFEVWLSTHVPKLLSQEKWFTSDGQPSKGDIVLFLKHESNINNTYQYGMIDSVHKGKDDVIRQATVKYKNHQEQAFRLTKRAIRSLVLIRSFDEIDIMKELGTMAALADSRFHWSN